MRYMFYGCKKFNADLSRWNTSNVEDMSYMFMDCDIFKSDLSNWDVSKLPHRQINIFKNCPQMKPALKPKFGQQT